MIDIVIILFVIVNKYLTKNDFLNRIVFVRKWLHLIFQNSFKLIYFQHLIDFD